METVGDNSEGNTKTSSSANNKRVNQLKQWFFTWNNYGDDGVERLETKFKEICKSYVFQEETGENGTPHLQGCIVLKKAMRWSEFKLPKEIHWEKTISQQSAEDYCSKEGTRTGKQYIYPPPPRKLKIIETLKPWQASVVKSIDEEPDDRTINVIYDDKGNNGKTALCKYLTVNGRIIIATGGRYEDIAQILASAKKEGFDLNEKFTFILNIPREQSMKKISYKGLESIKDGLMTSSKYESSTMVFNSPHIWVFCNNLPVLENLSSDRWRLWHIEDDELKTYIPKDDE